MPDLTPNIGVLYADRTLNSVVKAWDVNQNLAALQQGFQQNRILDLQAGLAMINEVRQDAKGIWGPQGDYTRKLVDRFEYEYLNPTPGPTPFSNTLNTALNSFTGHMVGNVLVTNEPDRLSDYLRDVTLKPSTDKTSFPGWDEFKAKFNVPVLPSSTTPVAPLNLTQVLQNLGGTPDSGITAFTAPQPYDALSDLFPSPSVLDLVSAYEGNVAVLGLASRSPDNVIKIARSQLGVDYVWGGETPAGFDCSGLVQWVFGKVGIPLPRTTWPQFGSKKGDNISWGQLQPADVLYFNVPGSAGANHTGIYVGNGKMIVAPHTGAKVQIQPLEGYWQQHFLGAKRFL